MGMRIALSNKGTPRIGCATTDVVHTHACMLVRGRCIINRQRYYNPDVCSSWRQDPWEKSRLMLYGFVYVLRTLLPCGFLPDLIPAPSLCQRVPGIPFQRAINSTTSQSVRLLYNPHAFKCENGTPCSQPRPAYTGVTQ